MRRRLLIGALAILVVAGAMLVGVPFEGQSLRVGEPSHVRLTSPHDRAIDDEAATEEARRLAAESAPAVYKTDVAANSAMVKEVTELFDFAESTARSTPAASTEGGQQVPPAASATAQPTPEERYLRLRERYPALDRSNPDGLRELAELTPRDLLEVRQATLALLQDAIREPIRDVDLGAARDALSLDLAARVAPGLSPNVAALVNTFLSSVIRPNRVVDDAATERRREEAAGAVRPVQTVFRAGQVIVERGEIISSAQLALLHEFGLGGQSSVPRTVSIVVVVLLIVAVVGVWIHSARPELWRSPRRLLMLTTLVGGFTVMSVLVAHLASNGNRLWGYLIPSAALAMLACILVDAGVAVVLVLLAGVVAGVSTQGNFSYAGFVIVGGLVPVPFVSHLSSRGDLLAATWRTGAGVGLCAGAFSYTVDPSRDAALALVAGVVNGLLSGFLTIGVLPVFEAAFDVLTPTRLLDLTDRNHPLIRELEEKAIGTYNHSIMVGTLAERAARRIGANGLLCRAAAYYHDIGKVRRAYFFVENQLGGDNPHDRITPDQSALIIKDHVTDGISMAKEHRIPAEIAEGILTHHGTGRIQYFLSKASVEGEVLDEDLFRHVGHKPKTREMGILMLADSCEGACRALAQSHAQRVTPEAVAGLVERIVGQKLDDQQLDECPLTFADLSAIRESFTETLSGLYHPRIDYPAVPESEAPYPRAVS